MRACATVFALLSADKRGRAKFVQRKSALVSLFDLLRSKDQGTQVICGKVGACPYCQRIDIREALPLLYGGTPCITTRVNDRNSENALLAKIFLT